MEVMRINGNATVVGTEHNHEINVQQSNLPEHEYIFNTILESKKLLNNI